MKLKKCSCCHKQLTTKNVTKRGRAHLGAHDLLYLNCNDCGSTVVLCSPPIRKKTA